MYIKIVDNIVLTSDPKNFILSHEMVSEKTGKPYLNNISFHPTLAGAVSGLLKMKMLDSTATDLKTLVAEHHKLVAYVRRLIE